MLKMQVFDADAKKGYNFPFILVYPQKFNDSVKIFVEGNNSVNYAEDGQSSFEAQQQYALRYGKYLLEPQDGERFNFPYLYQKLNQPLIIPIIERCDKEHSKEFYTQMLGRNVMLQKDGKYAHLSTQVVNMVNHVKEMLNQRGIQTENKSGLIGMSTSGVFAGRMLFAEPESFDVCLSVCSNAVQPLPLDNINGVKLPYPLGTADYREIFGKEFSLEDYKQAKQLFIVGDQEPNALYDIIKRPILHDPEVRDLYLQVYGDVGIQQRQVMIDSVLHQYGYNNVNSVVVPGGHELSGKGNVIFTWANTILQQNDHIKE